MPMSTGDVPIGGLGFSGVLLSDFPMSPSSSVMKSSATAAPVTESSIKTSPVVSAAKAVAVKPAASPVIHPSETSPGSLEILVGEGKRWLPNNNFVIKLKIFDARLRV